MACTCPRGNPSPADRRGRLGGIEAPAPVALPAQGRSPHIFFPGTLKAGVSQADSLQVAHALICSGSGRGTQRLNWDFSWPGTADFCLRCWAARASWQGELISAFLSAFCSASASPLITVSQRKAGVGNYSGELHAAGTAERKFFKNKGKKPERDLRDGPGSSSVSVLPA